MSEINEILDKLIRVRHILCRTKKFAHSDIAISYSLQFNNSYIEYGVRGLEVQILYVLNNLQYWRGEEARESKIILNQCVKALVNLR
tara:strand:+ start:381 stop:641 length:261 start_codon:yes stop_codon:yes gene_type:complete